MRKFTGAKQAMTWYLEWKVRLSSPSSSSAERLGLDRIIAGPTGGRGIDDIRALVADVSRCLNPGPNDPLGLEPLSRDERLVMIVDVTWDGPDWKAVQELAKMTATRWSVSRLMALRVRAWRKFENNLFKLGLLGGE